MPEQISVPFHQGQLQLLKYFETSNDKDSLFECLGQKHFNKVSPHCPVYLDHMKTTKMRLVHKFEGENFGDWLIISPNLPVSFTCVFRYILWYNLIISY